ncbi:MAG: UDP-N-acetylmuramoyl-L-alanine--D-glutamate ligase [Coriobacteriia bacterium]
MEPNLTRIAVLGLGLSGRAALMYLLGTSNEGHRVDLAAYDGKDTDELREFAAQMRERGVRVSLGADRVDEDFDLIIASPGISPSSQLIVSARERGAELIGELEFAYRESVSPWLAITGTNGKTTTTSLVAHLLTYGGVPAVCVGNIGTPAIDIVAEAGPTTALVAEVSSFQLALTKRFKPRVAVLLNITPDHVDWHGSLEAYAADKVRIFANQEPDDVAVVDVDDPGSAPYADLLQARGISVARVSRVSVPAGGAGVADGVLTIDTHAGPRALVHARELQIRGAHNVSNALAAAAAVHAWGLDAASIAEGLRSFEPLEHRLEPVGVVGGVEYVNDSKGTNPASTLMALTAYTDRPLVLLLGGRNKGNSFGELASSALKSCRAVIAFGEAAHEIAAAVADAGGKAIVERSMADAVYRARSVAHEGDVVLLSPASASFDEFSGYAERGDTFRSLVADLVLAGEESG